MSRSSPSSPRQWKATRSPLPASTCRSTQLWLTLSLPPTNHFANGGFDQSRTVSKSSNQSRALACSAQNPSKSASADSWIDASVTFACSRNSAGGSNVSTSSSSSSARSSVLSSVAIRVSSLSLLRSCSQAADRKHRAPERGVRHLGERGVPRGERRGEADPASHLHDARVRARVADSQHHERHREEQEDERDRRGGAQRGDEHVRREDAPG